MRLPLRKVFRLFDLELCVEAHDHGVSIWNLIRPKQRKKLSGMADYDVYHFRMERNMNAYQSGFITEFSIISEQRDEVWYTEEKNVRT